MANDFLKEVFQDMHSKVVDSVNPDSVIDGLFSKRVIEADDYQGLRQGAEPVDRCRDLLSLLHTSPHPQAFIYLRLALLDDNSQIVDEIDERLSSPSAGLRHMHLDLSAGGRLYTSVTSL